MRFAGTLAQLVVLSLFDAAKGISSCLDPASSEYECAGTQMSLGCVVDDDIPTALAACLDAPRRGRASITRVSFGQSQLTTLPAGVFQGMTSVETLSFFASKLSTVEAGTFEGLESLTYLDMSYNSGLTSLPTGLFSGLDNLVTLDMEGSNLGPLQAGVFQGMPLLDELSLWGNPIGTLEAGVFQGLPTLLRLRLSNIELTSVPADLFDGFEGFASLESMELDLNSFTEVPAGLFQGFSALKELVLNDSGITTLEEGLFQGLTSLDWLYLGGNEYTTLPADIFQGLSSLRHLSLWYNQLTTLPSGLFRSLTSLEDLYLTNNQLTTLPAGLFSELEALEMLHLEDNDDLQCVPSNTATDIDLPAGFVAGTCGCEPTDAVLCNDGLTCEAGIDGYSCGSFCSNGLPGVQTNNFCCLEECGTCGGNGCRSLPGGREGCCKGAIEDSAVMCSDSGASPCIIGEESFCSNGLPGVQADKFCCLEECGTCGGSGCKNRPGGGEGCCTGAIDDTGVLCDDAGAAPCIINYAGSFCSNGLPGVQANSFCCLEECGTCGGSGCRSLPGGAEGCCKGSIEDSAVMCSESEAAPCIIDDE